MPNHLKSNSMVWMYFTNDLAAKKGKCVFCGQLISYEKSTFSNLTRHLKRKHSNMTKNMDKRNLAQSRLHYVWNHYEKDSDTRAKCVYCQTAISCPSKSVGNLLRHLRYQHPTIAQESDLEFIEQDEEKLSDEPQSLTDTIDESFKESSPLHGSELEMEPNLDAIGIIPDNGPDAVKVECVNTNPDGKINEDDQAIIEEIEHESQSQQDVEMNCHNETSNSDQYFNHTTSSPYTQPSQETKRAVKQQKTPTNTNRYKPIAAIRTDEGSIGPHQFLKGIKDGNVRTAAYATSIALELESLQSKQRIVAQKLISDVLFNAKLENLTEHSLILAKLSHPGTN